MTSGPHVSRVGVKGGHGAVGVKRGLLKREEQITGGSGTDTLTLAGVSLHCVHVAEEIQRSVVLWLV